MKNPGADAPGFLLSFSGGRRCPKDRLRLFWLSGLVPVSMMQIGIMRVFVPHRLVLMPMRVRFSYWPVVVVLVMIVVDMPVFVRKRFVKMFVFMPFGKMQPKPQSHQQRRESQVGGQWLPQA